LILATSPFLVPHPLGVISVELVHLAVGEVSSAPGGNVRAEGEAGWLAAEQGSETPEEIAHAPNYCMRLDTKQLRAMCIC